MPTCDGDTKYIFDDAKRPALPYVVNACFEIKRHEPLTPFGGNGYEYPQVTPLSNPIIPAEILRPNDILEPVDNMTPWVWLGSETTDPYKVPPKTITERYLRHRPRKTTPHHEDRTPRRLTIVRQIRVRDGAHSQVVQCSVEGIQGQLVAKIFDPLYRWEDMAEDSDWDYGGSPVGRCESEWSREAAAYVKIEDMIEKKKFDGRYTPRFEGCWSFDIPYELELVSAAATTTASRQSGTSGDNQQRKSSDKLVRRRINVHRNVCLLLMEYIPGDSILHLLKTREYEKIPADVRINLLAEVAEAESALWHIRVSHGDRYARNVVVVRTKKEYHQSSSSACSTSSTSSHSEKGEEGARNGQEQREQGVQDHEWRVVWVDFGKSVVLDLPNAKINIEGRLPPVGKKLPNPINRGRGRWPIGDLCLSDDINWVDERYVEYEARLKWMEARWGEGNASARRRYEPVDYVRLNARW